MAALSGAPPLPARRAPPRRSGCRAKVRCAVLYPRIFAAGCPTAEGPVASSQSTAADRSARDRQARDRFGRDRWRLLLGFSLMVGILICPAGDHGLIDQNLGPAGQRRPLSAWHDRQRFVTVVEEAERRGAVACPSADGATAGRLGVFQVRWRRCVPRRHRGAVLGPPQVWALEGDHTPDAAGHTAARLGQGVAAAVGRWR